MVGVFIAFVYALITFGLVAEADSMWLKVAGSTIGILITIGAAMQGWKLARK